MDSGRLLCYILRKLEEDHGETISLDPREVAALSQGDVRLAFAKLSETPTESPIQAPPKSPTRAE